MAALTALTVLGSTRVVQAHGHLMANIPFLLLAGNTTLPAGEYSVQVSGPARVLILIGRRDPAAAAMINSNPVVTNELQNQSRLDLNRNGDRYFLSQVRTAGYPRGRPLLKPGGEKVLAQFARTESQGKIPLVASLPRNNP